PAQQAWALTAVARTVMAGGDVVRAESLARSISDPAQQAQALAAVARTAAAGGDVARAEGVARSITDPAQQAQALTAVARAVAAGGDIDRASRVLSEVLAVVSWQVPLSVMAEHWPSMVLRCADALSGNERSASQEQLQAS
ncbi:hypothetical protein, partial [Paractinoplanes ferrugineus]